MIPNAKPAKGGGGILNTNLESSGWTPELQNSAYVKARQEALQRDANLASRYRVQLPNAQTTKVAGGGGILNTNVESSGWTPSLQNKYAAGNPEPYAYANDYMSRVPKGATTTKVGGGGGILNTNVESSGWVTDLEKGKSPEYWKAKQEYQDNYKADIPIGTTTTKVGGGGGILNTNKDSTDWNDYSGYERRIPRYHPQQGEMEYDKFYDMPPQQGLQSVPPQQNINPNQYMQQNHPQQNIPPQQMADEGDEGLGDMKNVTKYEKSEKIVKDNGKQVKLTKVVKYMDSGEIKTEIFKTPI